MLKSGFKSSEFYAVLAGVGGIIVAFFQLHCNITQADVVSLLITLLTGGYAGARTYLKSQALKQSNPVSQVQDTGTPIVPTP